MAFHATARAEAKPEWICPNGPSVQSNRRSVRIWRRSEGFVPLKMIIILASSARIEAWVWMLRFEFSMRTSLDCGPGVIPFEVDKRLEGFAFL